MKAHQLDIPTLSLERGGDLKDVVLHYRIKGDLFKEPVVWVFHGVPCPSRVRRTNGQCASSHSSAITSNFSFKVSSDIFHDLSNSTCSFFDAYV